jgi:hypothetical protein
MQSGMCPVSNRWLGAPSAVGYRARKMSVCTNEKMNPDFVQGSVPETKIESDHAGHSTDFDLPQFCEDWPGRLRRQVCFIEAISLTRSRIRNRTDCPLSLSSRTKRHGSECDQVRVGTALPIPIVLLAQPPCQPQRPGGIALSRWPSRYCGLYCSQYA